MPRAWTAGLPPAGPVAARSKVDAGPLENRPHRTGPDLVAQPSQFTLDASLPPGRVHRARPQHQPAQLWCRAAATPSSASGLSPASLHQVPALKHDRGQDDDAMQSPRRGQQSGQRGEHCPVRPAQAGLCTWRRNTATSWRSTRSSALRGCALRASSPGQARTCRKIRYNGRAATTDVHAP